jgi:hypothetical protein
MEIDEPGPSIELIMERPLFTLPFKPLLVGDVVLLGDEDIPANALFEQVYVDKERLSGHVRRLLQSREQVSLVDVIHEHPLEQGLAELVAYLSLAAEDRRAMIHDERTETIGWTDDFGAKRQATVPLVIFLRAALVKSDAAPTMAS